MIRKPSKHQRTKQRCQDLGWKVHDRAKSFVLRYTLCMNYVTNTFLLVSSKAKAKKANKNLQQRTLSGFITIPL